MRNNKTESLFSLFGYFLLGAFMFMVGVACLMSAFRQNDLSIGALGPINMIFSGYIIGSVFIGIIDLQVKKGE